MEKYTVRVTKDYLVFCAAHFITYEKAQCERLHGHNYRVAAEISGPLDEYSLVIDFIDVKRWLRQITDELDHRVLLPRKNTLLGLEETEEDVTVRFGTEKTWVFPREDCVLLDAENTTAELLAKWVSGRLLEEIEKKGLSRPERVSVEVEETTGQCAIYEQRF